MYICDVLFLDIDECETTDRCQHKCTNTPGSYVCTCPDGYRLSNNKRTCEGEVTIWTNTFCRYYLVTTCRNESPCFLVPLSHVRPLATSAVAFVQIARSMASHLMILIGLSCF